MLSYAEEQNPEKNKETCFSFMESSRSEFCAIAKKQISSFNKEHIEDTLLKLRRVQRCATHPTLDKNVLDRKPFQLALIEAFENTTFDFEKFLDNLKRSRHKFNILAKKTDYTKEIFRIERKRK